MALYIGSQIQEQIANRLRISHNGHRLIGQAIERGADQIFVPREPAECSALEDKLIPRFGLGRCVVAPAVPLWAPAVAMGHPVVVPSERHPLAATDFCQLLDTSDMGRGTGHDGRDHTTSGNGQKAGEAG